MRRLPLLLAGGALGVLLGLAAATPAGATPADPSLRPFRQPDGTSFLGRLYGDEYVNGVETAAGYTVVTDPQGRWVFAEAGPTGRLTPTTTAVGPGGRPPAAAELTPHLRDEVAVAAAEAARESAAEAAGESTPPAVGVQPVLVVLVEFADRSLSTTDAQWAERFFGPDQSVADYYDAASYGALDLTAAPEAVGTVDDGVVRVTLARDHPDSGTAFGSFQATARAALAALPAAALDLGALDDDADGELGPSELHLVLVVAGREGSQRCAGPTVWGHRAGLSNPVTVDGVVLGNPAVNGGYLAAGELQCPGGVDQQATLGIWAHEMGHDLGWIDLYDIDGSSAGVDGWSLMGTHWLALPGEPIGTRPPLPDPFSRSQVGWVTPTEVTTPADDVAVGSSATTDDVLQVLPNPEGVDIGFLGYGGTGEYFLVENRRQEGYDVALPGCGVLVWHVDEARDNSDEDARRVDVEEAGDGNFQYGLADAADPFPSSSPANAAFGPATRPSSVLNSGLPSGVALDDFTPGCPATATLDVEPGTAPVGAPGNDAFTAARRIRLTTTGTARVRGTNVGATHEAGEPRHHGVAGTGSVWWSFRASRDGYVNLTTESTLREVLAVYTGDRVDALRRVAAVRGRPPGGAGGGPPAGESVDLPLGFPVERGERYRIAVDSAIAGETGGVRLFLDYEEAQLDARPLFSSVPAGQRPLVRLTVRNTSPHERLRVYGMDNSNGGFAPVDCAVPFTVPPGTSRSCTVLANATSPAGGVVRGRLSVYAEWPGRPRYATLADPWFIRVRR